MTKYPQAFKNYVEDIVRFCKIETYHGEYQHAVDFDTDGEDAPDSFGGAGEVYAEIEGNDVYLFFLLTLYPAFYASYTGRDYKMCGEMILHEMCHLFTNPLRRLFHDHPETTGKDLTEFKGYNERQVQRVRNTINYLLPAKWYEPDVVKALLKDRHGIDVDAERKAVVSSSKRNKRGNGKRD